jgi:hypothetical protein
MHKFKEEMIELESKKQSVKIDDIILLKKMIMDIEE